MGVQQENDGRRTGSKVRQEVGQRKQGAKYWVAMTAMGALVAYSPVSTATRVLYAQDTREVAQAATSATAVGRPPCRARILDSPGPAVRCPGRIRERGRAFASTLAREAIGDVESPGVSGIFTPEDALQRMLEGTGVVSRFTGPDVVFARSS